MQISALRLLGFICSLIVVLGSNSAFSSDNGGYLVQPGDVLQISVWKEQDLQAEVAVRPDGYLSFPLVGEIIAGNRSVETIQHELKSRLKKYIADAVVTVVVSQSLGNKIFVIGQVNKPGEFIVNRPVDVLQALSMAGGMTPFARRDRIRILRREVSGEQTGIEFKYSEVEKGQELHQNIVLKSGDTVVVP